MERIAKEYALIGAKRYPKGHYTTAEAERFEFPNCSKDPASQDLTTAYLAYAEKVQSGSTNAYPPAVTTEQEEFILDMEGVKELKHKPNTLSPEAWEQLLNLPESFRKYRTVWVNYMLGNLAGSHAQPDKASLLYAACRNAKEDNFSDSLGLAHASFKREYLAQTNLAKRVESGIKAVGYYNHANDRDRMRFCLEHLRQDIEKASESNIFFLIPPYWKQWPFLKLEKTISLNI